mmetsp:Transcript_35550/g.59372  ORF Transcript_35550/g.59372 Transcript_35550/m.59372 type:complete len:682 (+) Transcript_35550:1-2046(+)
MDAAMQYGWWTGLSEVEQGAVLDECIDDLDRAEGWIRRDATTLMLYLVCCGAGAVLRRPEPSSGDSDDGSETGCHSSHVPLWLNMARVTSLMIVRQAAIAPLVHCMKLAGDSILSPTCSPGVRAEASIDFRRHITLLYALILLHRYDPDLVAFLGEEGRDGRVLASVLLDYVDLFDQVPGKSLPVRKVTLLLWKVLLSWLGGDEALREKKRDVYVKSGKEPPPPHGSAAQRRQLKSTEAEIVVYRETICPKYMKGIDSDSLSKPIAEGWHILRRHMHVPVARLSPSSSETPSPATLLFDAINAQKGHAIVVMLKVLLAASPTVRNYCGSIDLISEVSSADPGVTYTAWSAHHADFVAANREVVSKAVAGIILLLLKHFRASNIEHAEQLRDMLVQSNCIVLLLKLLHLDVTHYVHDPGPPLSIDDFFGPGIGSPTLSTSAEMSQGNNTFSEGLSDSPPHNWRNYFTLVCFLRILQRITKRNPTNIKSLLQYKAPLLLKKLYENGVGLVRLYSLKLLKSQVRHLGRRWRQGNMHIITAVYKQVRPDLRDDWLTLDPLNNASAGSLVDCDSNLNENSYTPSQTQPLNSMYPPGDELIETFMETAPLVEQRCVLCSTPMVPCPTALMICDSCQQSTAAEAEQKMQAGAIIDPFHRKPKQAIKPQDEEDEDYGVDARSVLSIMGC